jgi:radical SAM-linked protein
VPPDEHPSDEHLSDEQPSEKQPSEKQPSEKQRRLRLRFSKAGKIRFTSHRDVARMWERALRRSGLPVAYSQGYVPHPLVSFGLALPTGCESEGEYLDVWLGAPASGETPVAELAAALTPLLPDGIGVQAAALVGAAEGSLQQEVASCDWELEVLGVPSEEELRERVDNVLRAPVLTVRRQRKGREIDDDVRPAILALSVVGPHGEVKAELATHPRGVRPADLVTALGADAAPGRACRTHQWIERDGARFEPLPLSGLATGPAAVQHARRDFPHVRDRHQSDDPGGSATGGTVSAGLASRGIGGH